MITSNPDEAIDAFTSGQDFVIFNGDCFDLIPHLASEHFDLIMTSPPYFMGKEYDLSNDVSEFTNIHKKLAPQLQELVKNGGNIAWQVGSHVHKSIVTPLDFLTYEAFSSATDLKLRNRIIWTFGHGTHAKKRFSGRHETVLWFSKGMEYYFDLDSVRVPQKYPGKRHYKGPKKGEWSGNPLGKNPTDIWDIPNVKANHIEKTSHPCQFPVSLANRLVLALSPNGGTVFDPFSGSGTSGISAVMNGRRYLGCELNLEYCEIAENRYNALKRGALKIRPINQEVYTPKPTAAVATLPPHFRKATDER